MRVLVSNDDGVDAPGIRILAEGLRSAGHEVYVVAPDRDRLRVGRASRESFWVFEGNP